jgi:hypothetical protein
MIDDLAIVPDARYYVYKEHAAGAIQNNGYTGAYGNYLLLA